MGDPAELPAELPSGTCLFHFCEAASFKDDAALFCGEEGREVLDMSECPLRLWFKRKDGWPVERIKREAFFPEPGEAAKAYAGENEKHFVDYLEDCVTTSMNANEEVKRQPVACRPDGKPGAGEVLPGG